jgi:23S rRNA pseudouridine955/2504/2580 synthase
MAKLIEVDDIFTAQRLDKFLNQQLNLPFGLIQKLIRQKKIKINGSRVGPSYKLAAKDKLEIFANLNLTPKNSFDENVEKKVKLSKKNIKEIQSQVIFKDENLIAINKPSGLATQGGSGVDYSVDDFLPYLKFEKTENPKLVHRLDKDTSGILLIARNKQVAEMMFTAFKERKIKKTYLALLKGELKKPFGVIDIPLLKKFVSKNEKVYKDEIDGKKAVTEYKVLKIFNDLTFVELRPITGRTHQLRVHCKEIGHPIINDVKYGTKAVLRKDISKYMCLHAKEIELSDYYGKKLIISSDLPNFMVKFI